MYGMGLLVNTYPLNLQHYSGTSFIHEAKVGVVFQRFYLLSLVSVLLMKQEGVGEPG